MRDLWQSARIRPQRKPFEARHQPLLGCKCAACHHYGQWRRQTRQGLHQVLANPPEDHRLADTPRFVADAMLGRLAKWLRILGYDVLYSGHMDDPELARLARIEERILLTRDTQLVKRKGLKFVLLKSDQSMEQLKQLVTERHLAGDALEFSRCLVCNTPLEHVEKSAVADLVPPYVLSTQYRFRRCGTCGRVYWRGTHWDRMRRKLAELGISS